MANRVLQTEVKEIIETTIDDISPFITAANIVVTDRLSGEGLSASLLKEIERWLSAHFIAMRERQAESEKLGDASSKWGGRFGRGLDFTQYGQQVKILDTTGILESIGMKKVSINTLMDLPTD
jgi:hypothetical protein